MVDVKQNYLTHINLRKKCLTVFIVLMRFHYYIGVMEIMGALIKEGLMLFCKAYCSKIEPLVRIVILAKQGGFQLKIKFILSFTLLFTVIIAACSHSNSNNSTADWAFDFVVWDGFIYQLGDEYVDDISEEIGVVTKFSDMEGTYSGNFSNMYEKGTKYYAITGISTEEAIAVEEKDGKYRKAIRNGKY